MKKIYSTIVISAMAIFAFAQQNITFSGINANPVSVQKHFSNPSLFTIDTLLPPSFAMPCFTSDPTPYVYYNWSPPAVGYVTGTDSLPQASPNPPAVGKECAQKYLATGTVNEVLVWYGHVTGSTGTTSVKIYSIDATTKLPKTVLGTSSTILTGALTNTALATYSFSVAVAVTNEFAVSAVLPKSNGNGDTVAIISTKIGCSTADSLSSFQLFPTYGWTPYALFLNFVEPRDTSIDLYLLPVGTLTNLTGVNDQYSSSGLSLLGAFPSPASDFTNLRYRLDSPSKVSIEVFDLSGRTIQNYSDNVSSGTHELKVSLKDISAGNYYYTINTGTSRLTSKFSVVK